MAKQGNVTLQVHSLQHKLVNGKWTVSKKVPKESNNEAGK